MAYYIKKGRHTATCLECGDKIKYGRADKKFCCEDCRVSYNNAAARNGRAFRRRVLAILSRNYEVLDSLVKAGTESADLLDLVAMGFVPSFFTSHSKSGKHNEYGCFDIKYIMTHTRVYSISKIQNFD